MIGWCDGDAPGDDLGFRVDSMTFGRKWVY